jgi:hypothetical protein
MSKFDARHLDFVKKCVARSLYFQGKTAHKYVGSPVSFSFDPALLRQHFPLATFVICVRDPCQTFPSLVDLIGSVQGKTKYDEAFTRWMTDVVYEGTTKSMYKALADWPGDDKTLWVDFEKWKKEGEDVLATVWNKVGWVYPAEATKAALKRSERHSNRPESYTVVPPEVIKRELGETFKTLLAKCQ